MGDARSEKERLPWLDLSRTRTLHPRANSLPKAARRARMPLFVLLSLFLMASVGMISYLAGRGSVASSPASDPALAPPPTRTITLPRPPPSLPGKPVKTEAPVAEASSSPATSKPSARPPASDVAGTTQEKARPRPVREAKATISPRAIRARRNIRQMAPLVRASPMVQLGTYRTRGQANAAFRRLTKVYPYLKKLPKDVRPVGSSGGTRLYRLRLREHSPEYARILCGNLHAIGRGCTVLPTS